MEDPTSGLRLFCWCILEVFVAFLDDGSKIGVERAFETGGERCCDQAERFQCLDSKVVLLCGQNLKFECVPQCDRVKVDGLGLVAGDTSLQCVQDVTLQRSAVV